MDATLSRVWDQTHGKVVRSGAMPRRTPAARAGIALAELPERYALPAAILRLAMTPRRWEPWNSFNEHRAYPSPRAAWLVDVSVVEGHRRWLVDPVRDRLAGRTDAPVGSGTTVTLDLTLHPERLPAGYAALAEVLTWLEAGHVAAALADSAAAHGWTATADLDDDSELTVTLRAGGDRDVDVRAWSDNAGTRRASAARPRPAARRTSGLGPRGLSADPGPLLEGTLAALAQAAHRHPAGSPAGWPGLRHRAVAARIAGLTDGLYTLDGGTTDLISAEPTMEAVQQSFSYPRDKLDVAGMNVGWVITADVPAAVRAGGLAAYRRLLLAAGAIGQHVGAAAAGAGLFCRPARSVHEAHLEAAVAAPAAEDFLYLLLIGRSRPRDFAYDLTPPEVLP
ncbi:hypothetical protein [Catellatospora sp. NPDC049133]|uniref:hypothetical protein n=1 Tax=Catellatospora sp. NPDC049133 TaxID=3155499 RepID=UPI0033DD83E1